MRRTLSVFTVLLLAGLSACGGGGGGGAASPYTGLTTPAVITMSNADNVARQAFQGGEIGASMASPLSTTRSGDVRTAAGRPMPLILVELLSEAATAAFPAPSSARAAAPRAVVTIDNIVSDGMGGSAHYTLAVNDQTGTFTGTFVFTNFHGASGGELNGTVAVSGVATSQTNLQILFNFRSVNVVDGTDNVTAMGTVTLTVGPGTGNAILNLYLTDNGTGKTVWLSNYSVAVTDLGGTTDIRTFGRIYLHDYGYVDIHTETPFLYPALSTQPTSGAITLTGSNGCRARLTVVDATTYTLELDADGNGSYEWSVTRTW